MSSNDVFDTLREIFTPTAAKIENMIEPKGKIIDLDYTITVDKIVVILSIAGMGASTETASEVIIIDHPDMEEWAGNKLMLEYDDKEGPDGMTMQIDYLEFLKQDMTRSDVKNFIIDNDLAFGYLWSI